ncbi:MAG: hypothetical protein MO852_13400 [Candidatus Devosia euplotis]|nr:hypothetical protein [Candidatus Devosia euplotis]
MTASAGLTDRVASANVAILSFVALLGFLVGPPSIGFVAEHTDMRLGIACVVPALLVSLALTGRLTTARPKSPAIRAQPPWPSWLERRHWSLSSGRKTACEATSNRSTGAICSTEWFEDAYCRCRSAHRVQHI